MRNPLFGTVGLYNRLLKHVMSTGRLIGLTFSMMVAGQATAQQQPVELTGAMVNAVNVFLNSLSDTQRDAVSYDFDDEERLNWHFIPRPRNGLSFNDMNDAQRAQADALLATFLGETGYRKVGQIRSLEDVLKAIEINGRFVRDPMAYYLTVFGQPSLGGTWAFRLEGHHIAFNWTFVSGSGLASTPQFFGSNPAQVRGGSLDGLRVLAREEDLGLELVGSLTTSQQAEAILELAVPGDILTGAQGEIGPLENTGIAWDALDSAQQLTLMNLIEEVAAAQPAGIRDARMTRVRTDREQIRFTWIGGTDSGAGNYWRIQGSDFLIEYDKTQNDANHIHLVWRDFDRDFGRDLLRMHYDAVAAEFGAGHRH